MIDIPIEVLEQEYPEYYHPEQNRDGKPRRRWGLKAFKLGWQAAYDGKSIQDCPYRDYRTYNNRITFSRAYQKRWLTGYRAAEKHIAGEYNE